MKAIGLVFEEADEEFIMQRLRAMQQERRFAIHPDSSSLPTEPYSVEEINQQIDEAEQEPSLSHEEAKAYLGL